jgi:hypothetical protein
MNEILNSLRKIRYPLSALLALVTFCGFGSCVLRTVFLRISAENVTAQKANDMLWHVGSPLQIPSTASNVSLSASFSRTSASFELDKNDFEQWASNRHWTLEPITSGQSHATSVLSQCFNGVFPTSIADGCSFTNSSNRGGWDVVYDRGEKRVWVSYGRH